MIIGKTIFARITDAPIEESEYYSPWFPANGNRAAFTVQFVAGSNIDSFDVWVQTKTSEQSDKDVTTDQPTDAKGTISTTTAYEETTWVAGAALSDSTNNGIRQLVRLKYVLKAAGSTKPCWVTFRVVQPQWFTH